MATVADVKQLKVHEAAAEELEAEEDALSPRHDVPGCIIAPGGLAHWGDIAVQGRHNGS